MFGFIGKYFSNLDYTTYGEMQGTNPASNRRIAFGAGNIINAGDNLASVGMAGVTGLFEYDLDGVSGSLPVTTNIKDSKIAAEPYVVGDHKVNLLSAKIVNIAQTSSIYSPTIQLRMERALNSPFIYYEFGVNGSTALTPATRRMNIRLFQPDAISYLCFSQYSNQPNATRNIIHALKNNILDLRCFPNLDTLTFGIGVVWDSSPLTVRFPEYLRVLHFSPRMPSSIIGKLPRSVEYFEGFTNCGGNVSLNGFFDDASNMISLYLTRIANQTQWPTTSTDNRIVGSLNISHMSNLKEFAFSNNSVMTGLTLPTKTDWEHLLIHTVSSTLGNSISNTIIENLFDSPSLVSFIFYSASYSITRNINNEDISNNLAWFINYGNSWSGNIQITDARTSIREFKIGLNQAEGNRFANVNISGLTGGDLRVLQFNGVECENLTLPSSLPLLNDFQGYDNKLDIVTNPDIITKINGYSTVNTLHLGNGSTSTVEINHFGQNSVNGLGANPNFSGLTNAQTLNLNKCGFSGTLTLPNVARAVILNLSFNPLLTSVANLSSHGSTLQQLFTTSCTGLTFSITSSFTAIRAIFIDDCKVSNLDLSGKNNTGQMTVLTRNCPLLQSIIFSNTSANNVIIGNGGERFSIFNCPNLTGITNLDKVSYSTNTGTNNFHAYNCALNMTFPFGTSNFVPNNIRIEGNGMSVSNVDATISNVYTNRTKWSTYATAKSMNIGSTNGIPTGTYQAPAGFVLGSNDGTPASAKEQVYVLVNNYGWTITMN